MTPHLVSCKDGAIGQDILVPWQQLNDEIDNDIIEDKKEANTAAVNLINTFDEEGENEREIVEHRVDEASRNVPQNPNEERQETSTSSGFVLSTPTLDKSVQGCPNANKNQQKNVASYDSNSSLAEQDRQILTRVEPPDLERNLRKCRTLDQRNKSKVWASFYT